ncbi:MAG: 50S ribosomal protein L21 [Oscillospiraceae bacterium]|nr:50S ribosomal protein L21 [Oscillospiraceae bacterium]
MYAIFKTGGKQYRVSEGDVIFVERLKSQADEIVNFSDVILVSDGKKTTVGSPIIEKAKITAKVLKNGKSKKIKVFTYKPKKGCKRSMGHRQPYTKLQIESIKL